MSDMGHVWTTPALQEESDVLLAVGCKCPACLRGTMTAGPDVVRGPGPNHLRGLDTHDPKAGSPDRQIDRFTSRHHHPRNWIVCTNAASYSHC